MKKLCLIIIAVFVWPKLGVCQYLGNSGHFIGDSVIIYIDNRVEINVSVPDYSQLKSSDKTIVALKSFITLIPEIESQLKPDNADLITYSVDGNLTVESGDQKFIYLFKNGQLSPTGYRDQAVLNGKEFRIFITTSDISKITDLPLASCLEKVIAILPPKSNWSKSLYYECLNGSIKELVDKNTVHDVDVLELNLSAGAGLVRNKWIPDITFTAGFGFNRKGLLKYNPYISSNLLFDFNAENKLNLNIFLNLGFRLNIENASHKPDLFGLEIGYLVGNKGDLFGDHTIKLGINVNPVKKVFLSPQLYFTENFKTVFPGIRIGVGF